jgi:mediator of replication checkpoint protein 1
MLANHQSEEDEPAGDDARERVRTMLMAKSKSPEPVADFKDGNGSDEEDSPVTTRKRKIRVPRRETPKSSPTRVSASPGLFVSPRPHKASSPSGDASESDEIPDVGNDRFMALVAKKREERLAREAELAKEKAKKAAERENYSSLLEKDDQLDDSDDNVERRLTQQARPTRKASKRAQEEILRETQRLSRNQQLAHNAITKKKVTKASLFAKFNFKPRGHVEEISDPVRPTSSSSTAPNSDMEMKETPPTSPASPVEEGTKLSGPATLSDVQQQEDHHEENLPACEEVITQLPSSPPQRLDKGKGKAVEEPAPKSEVFKQPLFKQRPIRVRPPKVADRKVSPMDDSDSDLEIVSETPVLKKKLESIFDRVPAKKEKESHPIHVLRMFANMTSPGKQKTGRNKKPSMTRTELQVSLQQRARQQAAREREEKLQVLRAKGIIVQTAEEREREMADVDDILARARREDEELMKREKAAAKKERKDNGEVDPLGDSSDDEDYKEGKEDILEELSVSGSDEEMEDASGEEENSGEEEDEGEDEMAVDAEDAPLNPMFDNEADESENDESEADLSIHEDNAEDGDVDEEDEEREQELPVKQKHRRSRNPNVISDDEDEDEGKDEQPSPLQPQTESPVQLHTESPMAPNSVLRSATKTFIPGLTVAGPAGLGLTQIFAGTMDESQMDPFENFPTTQNGTENSLAFLRQIPAPELLPFVPTLAEDTQDVHMDNPSQLSHVPESQPNDFETQGIELNFTQSQIHGFDSLVQDTQMSQFPEATQDVGFQHMTPIRGRFVDAPPSTVGTLVLDPTDVPETTEETPIVKKKGKLRRRAQVAAFSDDEDVADPTELNTEEDEFDITSNAFDVMRKASKKKIVVDEFDKKKSKAKEMVNEQAEESEDEYAGLGGASDDEDGEEDDYVKGIIDDEGGKDVDERKIAAFYAYGHLQKFYTSC